MKNNNKVVTIDVTEFQKAVDAISATDYPKVYQITYTIEKVGLFSRAKAWIKKLFNK